MNVDCTVNRFTTRFPGHVPRRFPDPAAQVNCHHSAITRHPLRETLKRAASTDEHRSLVEANALEIEPSRVGRPAHGEWLDALQPALTFPAMPRIDRILRN